MIGIGIGIGKWRDCDGEEEGGRIWRRFGRSEEGGV